MVNGLVDWRSPERQGHGSKGGKVEVTLLIPPSGLPGEAVLIILITLGDSGSYH